MTYTFGDDENCVASSITVVPRYITVESDGQSANERVPSLVNPFGRVTVASDVLANALLVIPVTPS